jgi:hypothetical protein
MTDEFNGSPAGPVPPPGDSGLAAPEPAALADLVVRNNRSRAFFLRRLMVLLVVAMVGFTLTTWILVRNQSTIDVGDSGDPARVVRTQLDAIARGDLRSAYALFSMQFRARVSFLAFHEIIAAHPAMFQAENVKLNSQEKSTGRAILDARIESNDGEQFTARFTLVSIQGRWWIDDIRWRHDEDSSHRSYTYLQSSCIAPGRIA